ncbi:MAG: protein kinase [Vicinamibacterales bacterium]
MSAAVPDARLSNYRLERLLGSGGMGSVYLAHDIALDRAVAIKFIAPEKASEPGARLRLIREARAAAALDHPNICAVYQVLDEPDGRACIVMQYVEGETVAQRLLRGPLDPRLALSIACDLADALAAAHKRGIVHRDLKPQNIIVTPERRGKLLDFGIARVSELATTTAGDGTPAGLTAPGVFIGTPSYMSPEQAQQLPLDGRSDLFSLGAVLFECLTGRRAFGGGTPLELFTQVMTHHPPAVSVLRPELTDRYDEICRRLLAKHPDDRFRSAEELLGALRVLVPDTAHAVTAISAVPPGHGARSRSRTIYAAAVVGAVLLAAVAVWLWSRADPFQGSILVADFVDRTGDRELTDAIRDGLTVKLQQSRSLNVLSGEQVIDALKRMRRGSAAQVLDERTAVALSQREGISMVLAGTVYKRDDVILVTVTGSDPMSGRGIFRETTEFKNDSEVFRGVDRLAKGVRTQLGESLLGIAQSNQPLDQVTTPSVDALKLYTRARERYVRGDADAAVPLLTQAIQIDSGFAMAHRLIARVYETRGTADKSREHLLQAYGHRESLTQKERFQVEASYFKGRGEYEKAVETLTAATNLFPSDGEARYELALALRDSGDTRRATEQLELTLKNAPLTTAAYGDLVLLLARTGEYARAEGAYDAAKMRQVSAPKLDWAYGMVLLGRGRIEKARAQFSTVIASSSVYAGTARLYLATADILEGKLQAATKQLELDVLLDSKDRNEIAELIRRDLLARTLMIQGRGPESQKQLAAMLTIVGRQPVGTWPHERLLAGTLLAETGDIPGARGLLAQLDKDRSSAFAESCYHSLAGEIAMAEGKPADALLAFAAAAAQYPRVITTRASARAYAKQEAWGRAQTEWRRVIDAKGEALREHFAGEWVLAHLELARASRAVGDVEAARPAYDQFLGMWASGGDTALRRTASAERRSLPGS